MGAPPNPRAGPRHPFPSCGSVGSSQLTAALSLGSGPEVAGAASSGKRPPRGGSPQTMANTEYKMPGLCPYQETRLRSPRSVIKPRAGGLPLLHSPLPGAFRRAPPQYSNFARIPVSGSASRKPHSRQQLFTLAFSTRGSCTLSSVCNLSVCIPTSPVTFFSSSYMLLKFLVVHFSNNIEVLEKYRKPDKGVIKLTLFET